jgi:hypothetical protein
MSYKLNCHINKLALRHAMIGMGHRKLQKVEYTDLASFVEAQNKQTSSFY